MRKTRSFAAVLVAVLVIGGLGPTQGWAAGLHWHPLGPEGGWAGSLATVPGQAGMAFAGMRSSGVWMTTDAARHWARLPLPPEVGVQYDVPIDYRVAVDPADPRTLYVTTPSSLWRSYDRGATWARSAFSSTISAFALSPSNPRVLYVSGSGYGPGLGPTPIYRSTDRGATWRESSTGIAVQPAALAVDPVDPQTLYFAGWTATDAPHGRFAASHDGGLTWQVLATGSVPATKLTVQASTQAGAHPVFYTCSMSGIDSSPDGGLTWSTLLAASNQSCDLALDPSSPGTLYAATTDFWATSSFTATLRKSRDGGQTWRTLRTVAGHVDSLAVDARQPARIYAGLDRQGVLKSEDGGIHWTVESKGLLASAVSDVAVDPAHSGRLYAGANGGILRSDNGGVTWTPASQGLPADLRVTKLLASPAMSGSAGSAGALYAGTEAGFYRSTDSGASWHAAGPDFGLSEVYDIAFDAVDPSRLYAVGLTDFPGSPRPPDLPVLALSDDAGATWSGPHPALYTSVLFSLAIDPADASHLYASGYSLLTSHDRGVTWSALWNALTDPSAQAAIRKVVTDPHDAQTLFAVMESWSPHRLMKSTDQGRTFIPIDAGLPAGIAARDMILDARTSALYAATTRGVFVSRDGGATWAADNLGMGQIPIVALTLDPARHALYASTVGRGVYTTQIP
jgi:photosystem II stability/assembly factor-like uncharacterized protein